MSIKQWKARRWVKKIVKKNNATQTPIRCDDYIHPTDKSALDALKKIPLFDKLCGKLVSIRSELQFSIENMASHVHITEHQLPHIYFMVKSICTKLGIDMPDLYLKLDRTPNAYTVGSDTHFIVIHSGLLECLEEDELYAVLAHECGHIACKHVLYHTVGRIILQGGNLGLGKLDALLNSTLIGSLITQAAMSSLELAYYHWSRCSELSADRIAVLCCEDANPVIESMMRLAGGSASLQYEIDRELFLQQAVTYKQQTSEKKAKKALEFLTTTHDSHPLLAVRAYEANEFAKTPEFLAFLDPTKAVPSVTISGELPSPTNQTV